MKRSLYRTFVAAIGTFLFVQVLLVSRHSGFSENLAMTSNTGIQQFLTASRGDTNTNTGNSNDWICSRFPRGYPVATAWNLLQPQLLQALNHPRDIQGHHGNWTKELLQLLSPYILEYSIKGVPSGAFLKAFIDKLSWRLKESLSSSSSSSSSSSPLNIVVFGGSIVEGTGCMRSPIPGGKLDFQALQECAWPFRLERALNYIIDQIIVGKPTQQVWIKIHNLAVGGTNSEAAVPILRYALSPVLLEGDGADIIINAYSANDNLPPAFHATTNTTVDSFHLARILQRNIQFVQAGRDTNSAILNGNGNCGRRRRGQNRDRDPSDSPIILYVNDYLGNQQESIVGESQLHQAIQWLVDVESRMGYVSVSHSLQRWVWADTSEEFFSAPWIDRKGRPMVNVHYGMAGHVTTTIALLYYFLRVILNYCDDLAASIPIPMDVDHRSSLRLEDYVHIEIPTKEWIQQYHPAIIRPNITQWDWKQNRSSHAIQDTVSVNCNDNSTTSTEFKSPCVFAFLAAPLGTHQRQDVLIDYLKPFILHQDGWAVQNDFRQGGFQNKLGLVAMKIGATMILRVKPSASSTIRTVSIHYLKSYGDVWQNSHVEFRAQVYLADQLVQEQVWVLEGFHDQAVSISYVHRVKMEQQIPKGGSFRLQMKLISGQMFKINALMFCRR